MIAWEPDVHGQMRLEKLMPLMKFPDKTMDWKVELWGTAYSFLGFWLLQCPALVEQALSSQIVWNNKLDHKFEGPSLDIRREVQKFQNLQI